MLRNLFKGTSLSTTISRFRFLSLTPKCYGKHPDQLFQGSNWQPADVIRTDDPPEPNPIPDDWDKYNRVVYPPKASGETTTTPVIHCLNHVEQRKRYRMTPFLFFKSMFIIVVL